MHTLSNPFSWKSRFPSCRHNLPKKTWWSKRLNSLCGWGLELWPPWTIGLWWSTSSNIYPKVPRWQYWISLYLRMLAGPCEPSIRITWFVPLLNVLIQYQYVLCRFHVHFYSVSLWYIYFLWKPWYNFCKLNRPGQLAGEASPWSGAWKRRFRAWRQRELHRLRRCIQCCTDSWPSKPAREWGDVRVEDSSATRHQRGGVPDVCEDVFLPDRDGKILRPWCLRVSNMLCHSFAKSSGYPQLSSILVYNFPWKKPSIVGFDSYKPL